MVIDVGEYQGTNAPFSEPGSAASFEPDTRTWVPLPTVATGVLTTASAAWTGQDLLVWGSNGAGSEVAASLVPGKATSFRKRRRWPRGWYGPVLLWSLCGNPAARLGSS